MSLEDGMHGRGPAGRRTREGPSGLARVGSGVGGIYDMHGEALVWRKIAVTGAWAGAWVGIGRVGGYLAVAEREERGHKE